MRLRGLWRNADFVKLLAGETVSFFGTLVGQMAIGFTAVLMLGAQPAQMGILSAAGMMAGPLVLLFAGVLVDRFRRRPLMIATDIGRALLLASVPLAALLGQLRIEQLYAVAFVVGILAALFEVAYHSYLPTLVSRPKLMEANSKLEASGSVAEVTGFGLAGFLVQLLTAPITILVDAISFVVSAACLWRIRAGEPAPPPGEGRSARAEIVEGLRFVLRDPMLRPLVGSQTSLNLSNGMIGPLYLLFALGELHLEPALIGIIAAVGGISSLGGAAVTQAMVRRSGTGPTMIAGLLLYALGALFLAFATGPTLLAASFLILQQLGDAGATSFLVTQRSLRQAVAPDRLLGRVNATAGFSSGVSTLAGALLGGALGQAIGVRPTLALAALGIASSSLWLVFSPVRHLRGHPAALVEALP